MLTVEAYFFNSVSLPKMGNRNRIRRLHKFSYIRPAAFIYVTYVTDET